MRSSVDRFVSNVSLRLDAKGRLSIPAAFRAVLARDGFEGLYVHPSLDSPALDCGGYALLAAIDGMIEALPPASAEREAMALALLGEGDVLRMDPEGRITLPEPLKAHAGITGEASLVGTGTKFQIWETGRFRARLAEARDQARTVRSRPVPGPAGATTPAIAGARE